MYKNPSDFFMSVTKDQQVANSLADKYEQISESQLAERRLANSSSSTSLASADSGVL